MENTVNSADVWYDKYGFKTWTVTFFDVNGYPIGNSEFYHYKSDAVDFAKSSSANVHIYTKDGVIT